jgi:hypothetical protein
MGAGRHEAAERESHAPPEPADSDLSDADCHRPYHLPPSIRKLTITRLII